MCNTDAFGLNDLYKDSCLTSAGGKSGVSSYDSSIMSLYEIYFIKIVCKLRVCSVIRETFIPSFIVSSIHILYSLFKYLLKYFGSKWLTSISL